MSDITGVVPATVVDREDPEQMGRVKVEFAWMSNQPPVSDWARIATPMAGPSRGLQLMPEEGDEVLVAFERGRREHPYVVGFLWNGEDEPAEPEELDRRTLRTVSGHQLEFDDTDGDETITLQFKGGAPMVELSDEHILLKFDDGNYVEIESGKVTIEGGQIHLNP